MEDLDLGLCHFCLTSLISFSTFFIFPHQSILLVPFLVYHYLVQYLFHSLTPCPLRMVRLGQIRFCLKWSSLWLVDQEAGTNLLWSFISLCKSPTCDIISCQQKFRIFNKKILGCYFYTSTIMEHLVRKDSSYLQLHFIYPLKA